MLVSPTSVGSDVGEGITLNLSIENLNEAGYTWVNARAFMRFSNGSTVVSSFGGQRLEAAAHDIIRLVFASGTIADGHIVVKGRRR